jgi:tRNA(adenine34) deaminase
MALVQVSILLLSLFILADVGISLSMRKPTSTKSYFSLRRFISNRIRTARSRKFVQFPSVANATIVHNYFMGLAIEEAKEAGKRGEVPIGCVIVLRRQPDEERKGKERNNQHHHHESYHVVSRGFNMVETRQDASAHAEMIALRRAAKQIKNWRLLNMTLYCTLEPCPICLSAIQAFRIQSLVYGAPQVRYGAVESHMRMLDDYQHPSHTIDEVTSGIMKEECAHILKAFFRKRRKEKLNIPTTNDGKIGKKLFLIDSFMRVLRF